MEKKFLSSLLIGAFVFGVGAANVQPVSAASLDKIKETKEKVDKVKKTKEKIGKAQEKFGKNKKDGEQTPPEPPKDENGNPISPPNNDSDRPEQPKDENGNPIAPPDRDGDDSNLPEQPKDKFGSMKDKYDKAKEIFK